MPETTPAKAKLAILFVDDDVNLLDGLRRALRGQRDAWEMDFVDGGRKALEEMAKRKFDVIVSDMRMPELDGAALLSEVERRYPSTVRIILSGYSEERSVLRAVGPAHQYVAKPADLEVILAIMNRTLALRKVLAQPGLRALVASLRNLPSPPDLFVKLTIEMRKDESALNTISRMIAADMAMTAELLKVTNSAYFGLGSKVADVLQAVRLLGLDTVRLLILSAGIFKKFEGNREIAALMRQMSGYGVAMAGLVRRFTQMDGADRLLQEQAICAGMLCCIGSLVFLDAKPRDYPATIRKNPQLGIEDVERRLFGATQAELGAYLLGLWGFGDPIIEAVLYQNRPSNCSHPRKSPLTYVHLARAVGPAFPLMAATDRWEGVLDKNYVEQMGMGEQAAEWKRIVPTMLAEGAP